MSGHEVQLHACTVNLLTGSISRSGSEGLLTQRERTLLGYLVARPSRDIDRDELLTEVWGYSSRVLTRAIDTTMRRLRDKVESDPSQPEHLVTVFGTGYRFEPLRASGAGIPLPPVSPRRWLRFGDLRVDPGTGLVHGPRGETSLTSTERAILESLVERMGGLMATRDLVQAVWGRWTGQTRALNTAMYRLRRKLEQNPDQPRHLLTVGRSGFRLVCDEISSSHTVATLVAVRIDREAELWDADPEGMGAQVAALLVQLETSATAATGVPTGDGWLHLFTDPDAAMQWAISLRSTLPPIPSLSIALNRGRLTWWTDPGSGRAFCAGPAVLRCRELLDHASPGANVADEGLLSDPVLAPSGAVVMVAVPATPVPASRQADLPWIGDRFVGRAADLEALRTALNGGERMITLVGPGGVGKSRLALQVCATEPGARFVNLADATSVEGVVHTVARALAIHVTEADPVAQLATALSRRDVILLWLDDADRAPLHGVVERWLAAAPGLRVLSTRRSAFGVRGERVLAVAPLDEHDATELFLERASPGQDLEEAIALARDLDGLPLALELAAARTDTMSAREIRRRLPDRLQLLTTSSPGRPERHSSLRASLDLSFQILTAGERSALAQASVFRGGFGIDAAEEVLDLSGVPGAPWVLDILDVLVRAQLVRVVSDRYSLLESIRAYADQQLSPSERVAAELAHGQWCARFGERESLRDLRDHPGDLAAELPNLAIAAERAIARADCRVASACALASAVIRDQWGPVVLGLELLDQAIALGGPRLAELLLERGSLLQTSGQIGASPERDFRQAIDLTGDDPELLAAGELGLANLFGRRGDPRVRLEYIERALRVARSGGQPRYEARALHSLALLGMQSEPERAIDLATRALAIARRCGDRKVEALTAAAIGTAQMTLGNLPEARQAFERMVALGNRTGHRRLEAMALSSLARTLWCVEPEATGPTSLAALALAREIGAIQLEIIELTNLASYELFDGRVALGTERANEALALAERLGRPMLVAIALQAQVTIDRHLGDLDAAAVHARRACELLEAGGDPRSAAMVIAEIAPRGPSGLPELERAEAVLRGGDRMSLTFVLLRQADALSTLDRNRARSTLQEARRLVIGLSPRSELGLELERVRALIA